MALTRLSTSVEQWWQQWRPGVAGSDALGYSCLVSDLQPGDFLLGSRHEVVGPVPTTGTTRAIPVKRLGVQTTITLVAASTIQILRPS